MHSTHLHPSELSRNLWAEIGQDHNCILDRLTLGRDGQHWGVMTLHDDDEEERYEEPFMNASTSFEQNIRGQTRLLRNFNAVKFVALGGSGDWAYNVDGKVFYSGPPAFRRAMRQAQDRGRQVLVRVSDADERLADSR